jgi:hypothetical protein
MAHVLLVRTLSPSRNKTCSSCYPAATFWLPPDGNLEMEDPWIWCGKLMYFERVLRTLKLAAQDFSNREIGGSYVDRRFIDQQKSDCEARIDGR